MTAFLYVGYGLIVLRIGLEVAGLRWLLGSWWAAGLAYVALGLLTYPARMHAREEK